MRADRRTLALAHHHPAALRQDNRNRGDSKHSNQCDREEAQLAVLRGILSRMMVLNCDHQSQQGKRYCKNPELVAKS